MTPSDIFETKWDRRDIGQSEKRPIGTEERKAMTDYYEAGLRVGKTSDALLEELKELFHKSTRQISRYIQEQRELRESSRQSSLSQHYEDLAFTASILARNASCLLSWKGSYEENWGDIVIGVQPRFGSPVVMLPPEDPFAYFRAPPTMANEYSAGCLLAHFNEAHSDLTIEDWKSITIQSVKQDLVDALQSMAEATSFEAVPECPACKRITE